jgi:hypothetical protein
MQQEIDDPYMRDIDIATRRLCILFVVSCNELKQLLKLTGAEVNATDRRSK